MGVLIESQIWAADKAVTTGKYLHKAMVDDITRCKKLIQSYMAKMPQVPGRDSMVLGGQTVLMGLDAIVTFGPIAWSKEKLYSLFTNLIDALSNFFSLIAPYVSEPFKWILDCVSGLLGKVVYYTFTAFEKFDDKIATPLVYAVMEASVVGKDFAVDKYVFVKNNIVAPVVDCMVGTFVSPVVKTASNVTTAVTSRAIGAAAWLDRKSSIFEMMWLVVEKSKGIDSCATGGRLENYVVKPAINSAINVDWKLTGGLAYKAVDQVYNNFQEAKGVAKPVRGSTNKKGHTPAVYVSRR